MLWVYSLPVERKWLKLYLLELKFVISAKISSKLFSLELYLLELKCWNCGYDWRRYALELYLLELKYFTVLELQPPTELELYLLELKFDISNQMFFTDSDLNCTCWNWNFKQKFTRFSIKSLELYLLELK